MNHFAEKEQKRRQGLSGSAAAAAGGFSRSVWLLAYGLSLFCSTAVQDTLECTCWCIFARYTVRAGLMGKAALAKRAWIFFFNAARLMLLYQFDGGYLFVKLRFDSLQFLLLACRGIVHFAERSINVTQDRHARMSSVSRRRARKNEARLTQSTTP